MPLMPYRIGSIAITQIKYWTIVIAAIIGAGVSLLHIFGLLDAWEVIIKDKIPSLLLFFVSVIIFELALENNSKLEKMEHLINDEVGKTALSLSQLDKMEAMIRDEAEKTIKSLRGTVVREFEDRSDFYNYVADKIARASRCISDISYGGTVHPIQNDSEKIAFDRYRVAISDACKSKRIIYREIISFPNDDAGTGIKRLERIKSTLNENLYAYQLSYYDMPNKDMPPFLQFMIIDHEDVIFGHYKPTPADEKLLVIRHPDISALFCDYYEAIWQESKKIKVADTINQRLLEEIEAKLKNA